MTIRFLFAAAALAALACGVANAEDTIESLRAPVIEKCKADMGGAPDDAAMADKFCTCMVDGIIAGFGDDTLPMLRILNAGLKESDKAGIAALLGLSEAEVAAFIERANAKIKPAQDACTAQLGGEP